MAIPTSCELFEGNTLFFLRALQSNIESIMNSEQNTLKLIEMLDSAVEKIEKLDKRLNFYEDKISAVGDAVRIVGERDNVIQLQQNNQHALVDLLDGMMSSLEFTERDFKILSDCDLTSSSRSVASCVAAGNRLLDVLETNIPPGQSLIQK